MIARRFPAFTGVSNAYSFYIIAALPPDCGHLAEVSLVTLFEIFKKLRKIVGFKLH
jgi:hypothetical protein